VRIAHSVEEPGRGAVRIASIATAAERMLLPQLAEFRREYPEAEVTVRVGNRATVWSALASLDADLVVGGRPPASLGALVLGRATNELVVVGPPGQASELDSKRSVRTYLAGATWLLREEGSGTRDATEQLLAQLGVDPPRMILGSNGAVEEAVVAGFGVALLPRGAVGRRLAMGAVSAVDCPGTPIDRPWHLVASGEVALSPTARLAARSLLGSADGFCPTAEGRRLLRG
jgi:DNA-binding transcriptional LysR family regulator